VTLALFINVLIIIIIIIINVVFRVIAPTMINMESHHSTRVSAPDNSATRPLCLPSDSSDKDCMMDVAQSPSRDGGALKQSGKKAGAHIDLRLNARLATWNVTSATDTGYQDALVRELARLQLSITGITEARLTGAGTRCIENALILHSGGDTHINGVALVVLPPFVRALVSWKPISDRLLTARFAHKHGHFSVVVCYAPTEPSDDTAKENFYNQLSSLTQSVPPHDLLFILGDFNAAPGPGDASVDSIGRFSSGTRNDNSERLLTYCGLHDLVLPGTWFRRLDIHHWT